MNGMEETVCALDNVATHGPHSVKHWRSKNSRKMGHTIVELPTQQARRCLFLWWQEDRANDLHTFGCIAHI
jgi:hypothetical protein